MTAPIEWFAPGRVNLIGEHTDYNAGLALPVAIQLGCRCRLERTTDRVLTVRSGQIERSVTIEIDEIRLGMDWAPHDRWAAYVAGVWWAAPESGGAVVEIDSDLPIGAGLSSSAALCCSVAGAVLESAGLAPTPEAIAALATAAESEFVGAPTGRLDQLAVTEAQAGKAMLIDFRSDEVRQVPFVPQGDGLAVVVVDTGAAHAHAGGEYADRRASCEEVCRQLDVANLRELSTEDLDRIGSPVLHRRARHVLTENERVVAASSLLKSGRIAEMGPLWTASHESMRTDYEITVPRVDHAVEALMEGGALGARMTGGGFGGCVIGLVSGDDAERSIDAVRNRLGDEGLWATKIEVSGGVRRSH